MAPVQTLRIFFLQRLENNSFLWRSISTYRILLLQFFFNPDYSILKLLLFFLSQRFRFFLSIIQVRQIQLILVYSAHWLVQRRFWSYCWKNLAFWVFEGRVKFLSFRSSFFVENLRVSYQGFVSWFFRLDFFFFYAYFLFIEHWYHI